MKALIISLSIIGSILLLVFILLGFSSTKYIIMFILKKKRYLILKKEITFLPNRPDIDGQLDKDLSDLPIRKFSSRIRLSPFQRSIRPHYRLAYGHDFFYLYIEVKAKEIVKRDRGFQNGDGFHMLIANPKPDQKPTDEFYVLGFSPNKDSSGNQEKYIWYHDINVQLSRLGEEVKFAVKEQNGKIGYELLLPWNNVYPYHPWTMERKIGFNLSFVKAKKTLFEFYNVLFDWRFQAENQKRNYTIMTFESLEFKEGLQSSVILDKNCIEGKKTTIKVATFSEKPKMDKIIINIISEKGENVQTEEIAFESKEGFNKNVLEISTNELLPGTYKIKWQIGSIKSESELTVLPAYNYQDLVTQLDSCCDNISKGSYHTIQYRLDRINKELNKIKWYENYPKLLASMLDILDLLQKAKNGIDTLALKTGSLRRAFVSEIDSSKQPYSIDIPENYNSSQKYPLIVFLHGSGVDDRNSLKLIDFIDEDFFKLAPKARGASHYYGTQKALIDIAEAIADVENNYNIDKENIILAGFSMGGYGVYRTYKEYPELFKGLVIFSGQTKIPFFIRLFTKGRFVNFLKKKNLQLFVNIPIFIFHGTLDKNCSYKDTADFVAKLRLFNESVEFQSDKVGHDKVKNQEIIRKFNEWILRVIK